MYNPLSALSMKNVTFHKPNCKNRYNFPINKKNDPHDISGVNFRINGKTYILKNLMHTNSGSWYIYNVSEFTCKGILKDTNIIAKVMVTGWLKRENVISESSLFQKASNSNISPKYIGTTSRKQENGKEMLIIFMKKWGMGTLDDLSKTMNITHPNIHHKLKTLLDKMYNAKIVHLDLHPGNILYNIDKNGVLSFKIIDFGSAKVNYVKPCNRSYKIF